MTRVAIDHDGDGAYVRITRPGQAAEIVPLTHRAAVRLMSEAAEVVLAVDRERRGVRDRVTAEDAPEPAIGMLGE